jgi:SnoaL-like domain
MLSADDHVAVVNHIARYNHAIDLGTPEQWADCFTDDAEFDARPVIHCHGRDDLIAFAQATLTDKRLGRHWTSNVLVDGDGERATTRVYLMMVRSGKVGETGATGVYEDRLRKIGGQWRFEYRKLNFEDPPDWSG